MCMSLESIQVNIAEEGGVEALLMLLQSSQNSKVQKFASCAIANLVMNGKHFYSWLNYFYDNVVHNQLNDNACLH